MKTVMMGDCRLDSPKPDDKQKMKEGDYLRLKMNIEDEEVSGCIPLFKSRSSPHIDLSGQSKSTDNVTSMPHHSKFTEKVLRMFRSSHSDHGVSSKQSTASTTPCGGQQPARRKYMRVVTDRNAPPPDKPNDNPNIIPHYSQQYLRSYYGGKQANECDRTLPYVVSDNSILKKSSTDPTSDRRAAGGLLETTIGSSEKHATFNDVVTVFDSFQHTVTTEKLHCVDDSDAESDNGEDTSGKAVGNFFLGPDAASFASQPEDMVEGSSNVEDTLDSFDAVTGVEQVHAKPEPQAMHNIFAPFTAPPDVITSENRELRSLRSTRQVDLKSIVEMSLATVDSERID